MKIIVLNFQSLEKATVDAMGLTVIVGPSDRGKSALVRAIDGCLFNKGGEQFVREGSTSTEVTLRWEAGLDQHQHVRGHEITWTKGGGKNRYVIDGETFDKVGAKAPPPLQALGFMEVLIGGRYKDEGGIEGGEWVRPQIAGQFDGIFLLDRPGTFLNEVIVRLSRLSVLQRASRQCVLDLKQTKQLLTTRQKDLEAATREAEALAKAPLLRTRLDLLQQVDADLWVRRETVGTLKTLIPARQIKKRRTLMTLPAQTTSIEAVSTVREQYQQLQNARTAILLRARLKALPKKLPKAHTALKPLEIARQRWEQLQDAMGRRELAVAAMMAAQLATSAADTHHTAAVENLQHFLRTHPTCPVCAQPWSQAVGV